MALQIFLMNYNYQCSEFFQISHPFDFPNHWKKTFRRKGLNYESERSDENGKLMLECLRQLFYAYKERHGFDVSYENDEQGIEELILLLDNKNLSIIVIVYENMILYGDLLRNSTNISTLGNDYILKLESIVDEIERCSKSESLIQYLRPDMAWVKEVEDKTLERATFMAYVKIKSELSKQ
jgi:hypothetical protein